MHIKTRRLTRPSTIQRAALTAGLIVVAAPALAHPGGFAAHGFAHGFAHPLGGVDHILATVTLGILAYRGGRRLRRLLPALWILGMAIGAAMAAGGLPLPAAEAAIAGSAILLAALVLLRIQNGPRLTCALAAAIAIPQGHAHAIEMTAGTSPVLFGAGLLCATALLYLGGLGAARHDARQRARLLWHSPR